MYEYIEIKYFYTNQLLTLYVQLIENINKVGIRCIDIRVRGIKYIYICQFTIKNYGTQLII